MKAINATKDEVIAEKLEVAQTVLARMTGLLGKTSMEEKTGLLITPCKGIHTFGMKFDIDAVFINKDRRIVAVVKNIPPNRMTRIFRKAVAVIELPSGSVERSSLQIGDSVEIA